jgi:glycosyltransferase involved in cell wall biosynthesis
MRIALLTTSFPRTIDDDGGIFIARLVDGFIACGDSGVVIVPHDSAEPLEEPRASFRISRYRYRTGFGAGLAFGAGIVPNLRARPWLITQAPMLLLGMVYKAIKLRKEYDVIHANWLFAGIAAYLLSILIGKPYVVTIRGEDLRISKLPLISFLVRRVLSRSRAVTTVSDVLKPACLELMKGRATSCTVIENGVHRPQHSEEAQRQIDARYGVSAPYILFVGTVIPRKRVHLLIKLLSQPTLQNVSLVLAGRLDNEAYVAQVKELAEARGVAHRLKFLGLVPPSLIDTLLTGATAYVSASEYEGRSNAVLEAYAAGVPLCLSDIPEHRGMGLTAAQVFYFSDTDLVGAARFIAGIATVFQRVLPEIKSWKDAAQEYRRVLGG